MQKTNVARLLDKAKITYELIGYEVDENDLSAVAVASKLGQDIACVFKTLVLTGNHLKTFVVVIPGGEEVNLKLAAGVSGNKNAAMVPMKDLLPLTGYIRGGCSPIGMKKKYPTFIDESCLQFDSIFVSAGIRGLQLKISPGDLIRFTGAAVARLV